MQSYIDIHKNEAIQNTLEWVRMEYPNITEKSFRIVWFAYIRNGWKCMLSLKENPGVFYEITKNVKTGEIYECKYVQTAYFVKPSTDKALEFSTTPISKDFLELA